MISLMTLALIWSRFWSGEPRHKQSLVGSKCPFCTSLVPSAGSAAPSSWFTHSWVQTNLHIHRPSHTHTHGREMCCFKCRKLMREIITNMCIWVLTWQLLCLLLYSLFMSMNTGAHPATHSHLERSLVAGTTGKTAGSACHRGKWQARETETSTPRLNLLWLFLEHTHAHTITLDVTDARRPPKHAHCAHTQIHEHSATALLLTGERPNDLGF